MIPNLFFLGSFVIAQAAYHDIPKNSDSISLPPAPNTGISVPDAPKLPVAPKDIPDAPSAPTGPSTPIVPAGEPGPEAPVVPAPGYTGPSAPSSPNSPVAPAGNPGPDADKEKPDTPIAPAPAYPDFPSAPSAPSTPIVPAGGPGPDSPVVPAAPGYTGPSPPSSPNSPVAPAGNPGPDAPKLPDAPEAPITPAPAYPNAPSTPNDPTSPMSPAGGSSPDAPVVPAAPGYTGPNPPGGSGTVCTASVNNVNAVGKCIAEAECTGGSLPVPWFCPGSTFSCCVQVSEEAKTIFLKNKKYLGSRCKAPVNRQNFAGYCRYTSLCSNDGLTSVPGASFCPGAADNIQCCVDPKSPPVTPDVPKGPTMPPGGGMDLPPPPMGPKKNDDGPKMPPGGDDDLPPVPKMPPSKNDDGPKMPPGGDDDLPPVPKMPPSKNDDGPKMPPGDDDDLPPVPKVPPPPIPKGPPKRPIPDDDDLPPPKRPKFKYPKRPMPGGEDDDLPPPKGPKGPKPPKEPSGGDDEPAPSSPGGLPKYAPANCKPISKTASSISSLASQGILQATNKRTLPAAWSSATWTYVSKHKRKTGTFARGATSLEKTNTGGDGGHEGIDQPLGTGSDLYAIGDGVVAYVLLGCKVGQKYCGNAWGNQIVIDHGKNRFSRYAHVSASKVKVGQVVKKGDVVCKSGNTGLSDGPHLHFEIGFNLKKKNGKPVSKFTVVNGLHMVDPCDAPPVFETVYNYEKLKLVAV